MSMQQIMRWGHDFLRISGRKYSNLWDNGEKRMSKGEPIKLSTTHFVSCAQSFNSARNWLSQLLHGMGKVWQFKFEFGETPIFGKMIFDLWGKLLPKNAAHSLMHPCFWSSRELSFTFLQFPVFFPHGWEFVLLIVSGWDLCWSFLWLFSSLPGWEKCFWFSQRVGEETHDFWVLLSLFWPRQGHK